MTWIESSRILPELTDLLVKERPTHPPKAREGQPARNRTLARVGDVWKPLWPIQSRAAAHDAESFLADFVDRDIAD